LNNNGTFNNESYDDLIYEDERKILREVSNINLVYNPEVEPYDNNNIENKDINYNCNKEIYNTDIYNNDNSLRDSNTNISFNNITRDEDYYDSTPYFNKLPTKRRGKSPLIVFSENGHRPIKHDKNDGLEPTPLLTLSKMIRHNTYRTTSKWMKMIEKSNEEKRKKRKLREKLKKKTNKNINLSYDNDNNNNNNNNNVIDNNTSNINNDIITSAANISRNLQPKQQQTERKFNFPKAKKTVPPPMYDWETETRINNELKKNDITSIYSESISTLKC
jgi:hypothetical protein